MKPLVLLCSIGAVVVLDYSIVFVAVPSIQASLDVAPDAVPWLANAYALTFGALLLLGGRLGDQFGRRRVLTAGLSLFTASSLLLALSPSTEVFLAGRIVQGLGAALLAPAALALLTVVYREDRARARAIGAYGAAAGGAAALGTLLGGVLTELASWHWAFLINIPLGVLAMLAVPRILPADERAGRRKRTRLDIPGAATVTTGLFALVYAITRAEEHGFASADVLAPSAVGLAFLIAFVVIERRAADPLVRLSIFRMRGVAVANGTYLLAGSGTFGALFLLSLYFQQVRGYDALEAGLAVAPLAAGTVAASALATVVAKRLGQRVTLSAGFVALVAGLLLLSGIDVGGSFAATVLPGELLAALGLGLVIVPITALATEGIPADEAGLASGLFSTAQELGGALGLAILTTIATSHASAAASDGAAAGPAQVHGFEIAFQVAAGPAVVALVIAWIWLPRHKLAGTWRWRSSNDADLLRGRPRRSGQALGGP